MKKLIKFLIFTIYILSTVLVMYSIYSANIISTNYMIVIFVIEVLLLFLIVKKIKSKKSRFGTKIFFSIIAMIISVINIMGMKYLNTTSNFVKNLSSNSIEKQTYSVLVLKESNYSNIKELNNRKIGFLENNNEKKASAALKLQARILFKSKNDNISNLIVNLNNNNIDALALDNEYIDVLKENQPDFIKNTKVIYKFTVITTKKDKKNSSKLTNEPFIVYISGSDTRGDITSTGRSDVNMVAVVNPKDNKILLVSIPRDYYVQLHNTYGVKDKLTHAGIYGIDMSKNTIEDLLNINVNYYLKVGFKTIIKSVDVIGGIDINSDKSFTAYTNKNCSFTEGVNHVNGDCALAFSRERYAYVTGDRHRGQNQQQVIEAIINKMSNPKVLIKYNEILKSIDGSFETDMSYDEITNLIKKELITLSKWKVESISLDGTGASMPTYSMGSQKLYVMIPDENTIVKAKEKINEYLK